MKIFLVINLSYFGDVLLTNALCQNIKMAYPDSKIVFMVNKPFYEAALYQKDVDEVICFDKGGKHKNVLGLMDFVLNFPYRNNIYATFVMYNNDRGIVLSSLIGSKYRVFHNASLLGKLFVSKKLYAHKNPEKTQDAFAAYLSMLTGKDTVTCPIRYQPPKISNLFLSKIKEKYKNNEIIGLCTTGKDSRKDMPVETAGALINRLTSMGKKVFYFGAGEVSRKYAQELKNAGFTDFVDLTGKTTISQLGAMLKTCEALISVDTGTMHLACAVDVPVVAVFYLRENLKKWAPRENLYTCKVISDDFSCENIIKNLETVTEKCAVTS